MEMVQVTPRRKTLAFSP